VSDYWEAVVISELLRDKYQLEAEMRADPNEHTLRARYFDILNTICCSHFGSFFAVLPEIATPLLFRGGSSDVWNMQQVFMDRQYDIEIHEPRRILDLGAYVGYTAVYFANRFRGASIISVEPPGSNFDTLVANTAAYPNIRCLPAAVWREHAELTLADCSYGDWGLSFRLANTGQPAEKVPGYTITNILEMHGWSEVDLIKCSTHGGRIGILLASRPDWLGKTATVITRPGAQGWQAGDAEELLAALPEAEFHRSSHGPLVIFRRRLMERRFLDEAAATLHLIPTAPQYRSFNLSNVEGKLNFYRVGYAAIQLTPNPPGSPEASVFMQLKLTGQSRFITKIATSATPLSLVRFKVQLLNVDTDATALCADHSIHEGTTFDWDVEFTRAWGMHKVILSTENIEIEDEGAERRQTAHFIEPRLM
jgi:FkbM family methyltransferase